MLPPSYDYVKNASLHQYEFYSEGPKGKIKKIVMFNYFGNRTHTPRFNLGFGDYNPQTGKISDLTVSDNGDRDKILTTVAKITTEFISAFPECHILIQGSTPSRIRLYQICITKHLHEITNLFDLWGLTSSDNWEPFTPSHRYMAFFLFKKTI